MEKIKPRTLSGFMELLPQDQVKMEKIKAILQKTYSLYGFTPLDTPVIEASEVLLAKAGGETEKQIYRFSKGNNDLALRFDLTVPLAKYVVLHYGELAFPFRRFQIGKVYRGERAQRGRFREFYQADIDIIGDGKLDIMNEAEIPAIIYQSFTALGLTEFKIRINNRKLINGFFDMLGLADKATELMHTIDKLDKIGVEKCRLLLTEYGLEEEAADKIIRFISTRGKTADIISELEKHTGKNDVFDEGVYELRKVVECLPKFGVPDDKFEIDLTIARGLDYYTGTVYETLLTEHPEIGSICSGGRYDNLAEYYTDKKLPGVGISIGLTRLFYILEEQDMLSDELITAPVDVLIIPMTEDKSNAVEIATLFREKGIRSAIYSEDKKFRAKMSYADKIAVPFVAFLGDEELKKSVVKIKDMQSGEQTEYLPEEAANTISSAIARIKSEKPIKTQ